ncbi:MAG: hypothetical protein A3F72_00450 [Bacteroidetes bacterium RIFCSPLOWO2_12_FULL_35_15]|nr:MAG: hypothetical protein A3F72_00450 [Bacteroidetes bacterium RIFCSPLOWO2_12_FULL_35_15]
MKIILKNNFTLLFLIIVALVLYANNTNSFSLTLIFKPLLVISLLVYLFIENGHKEKPIIFAICGLLLSLVGDVLLIFQEQNSLFFIGGLVAFLLAHLSYIFYYVRSFNSFDVKKLKNKTLFILLMVVYGILLYALIYNNLGGLKAPVLIYTAVLISMNIFALNRYGKVNNESFKLIMIGALCFVLSDSLLAINKFLLPIPLAGAMSY